jgi:hypothetical protein
MARLREQTRRLRKVLNAEHGRFLLRYSQNAHQLRNEHGIRSAPDEFRKILRATIPWTTS